jgi:hypothetical protein
MFWEDPKRNIGEAAKEVLSNLEIYLLLQYKSNVHPVRYRLAMNGFFNYPAFIKVFIYKGNFVSGVAVGNRLLININIYSYNFLCHDVF